MTWVLVLLRHCCAPSLDSTCRLNFQYTAWLNRHRTFAHFLIVFMIADHGVFYIFVKFLMCNAYSNGSRMWCSNVGLFVPLHFCSREWKVHRWNFHSCGTVVLWNIRFLELSLLWNFRSSGANVPRTFAPWNFRSCGTFVPSERIGYSKNFRSKRQKTIKSCSYTPRSSLHALITTVHWSLATDLPAMRCMLAQRC